MARRAISRVINALIELPTETVLVLDDYHFIEAQPIHDDLTYLVEHLPVNVHLVLASRRDPPLPLGLAYTRHLDAPREVKVMFSSRSLQEWDPTFIANVAFLAPTLSW